MNYFEDYEPASVPHSVNHNTEKGLLPSSDTKSARDVILDFSAFRTEKKKNYIVYILSSYQ